MGHHIGERADQPRMVAAVQRSDRPRAAGSIPTISSASASCRKSPGGPCRQRSRSLSAASTELGFIGCNLNPDPSGGHWTAPPLTDSRWYPLYEKMVELDVPAMVHVSGSCNPAFHATGAHYINADTTAFMQFIQGDLFKDFPSLRLIIPHGGGAVPYPLGALPRPGAGHEAAAADRACDEQRVLRHLRLSPARHRSAAEGDPGREHPVRFGNGGRGARHRSRPPASTTTTPSAISTLQRFPPPTSGRSSKATRGGCIPGLRPGSMAAEAVGGAPRRFALARQLWFQVLSQRWPVLRWDSPIPAWQHR